MKGSIYSVTQTITSKGKGGDTYQHPTYEHIELREEETQENVAVNRVNDILLDDSDDEGDMSGALSGIEDGSK